MTEPADPPLLNVYFPDMKSASLRFRVEATRPPTLTSEPAPNNMPLELSMNTWPLALRLPRIWLAFWPSTRLSAIEVALGWLNRTVSLAAMPKLCQLIARFWLLWLTVVLTPVWEIAPTPALICPPVGAANVMGLSKASAPTTLLLRDEPDLPRALAFSETAIQVFVTRLQIRRYIRFMASSYT